MKTNFFLLVCVFSGLFLLSCENDDNINVDTQMESLFKGMYPSASVAKWEIEQEYYVADFWMDGYEGEAWFDKQYKWVMTEFDLPFDKLPEVVKNAHLSGEYASWHIDDVDRIDYADQHTEYIIEVEKGEQEIRLVYLEDGTLKNANGSDTGNNVKDELKAKFNEMYPLAKGVEWELEKGYYVADFWLDSYEAEAWFDSQYNWLKTEFDIRYNDLPEAVKNVHSKGEYASWSIDDVDKIDYAGQPTEYIIEVEKGEQEVRLIYLADGTLTNGNSGGGNTGGNNSDLKAKFNVMYPSAKGVEWEMERGYYVADFWLDGYEAEAWFDNQYNWIKTEFDIRFNDLPEAVKNTHSKGEYADWSVDDVDKIDYADLHTEYIIEVEKGNRELHLVYSSDGILIKTYN